MPAVKETGFELYRLDDRPRPGLIDNRMRVEIRAARFLVCDLTDENRGAYWESGFAEGAGKPVFYICEKTKFSEARTHFDTEHMQTIRWEETDPASAAEELKAAIHNEFPSGIRLRPISRSGRVAAPKPLDALAGAVNAGGARAVARRCPPPSRLPRGGNAAATTGRDCGPRVTEVA